MQPICSKRTPIDSTSTLLFQPGYKELTVKGTDLEISLQASCPVETSELTADGGSFLVPGRRLYELIRDLSQTINFEFDGSRLHVTAGSASFSLNVRDAADFPPFPERIENMMQLNSDFFLELVNKLAFLIPSNNANPALNGVFCEIGESMSMTTTDGHCLARVETDKCKLESPQNWLIPRRAVFELKRIIENHGDKTIFLGVCGNQLVFSGESFNFFTKLLASEFPEYRQVLSSEGFEKFQINREAFLSSLKRAACMLSGQFIAASFTIGSSTVGVKITNHEVGELSEEVPSKDYSGEELKLRFYPPYLLNGLNSFLDGWMDAYVKTNVNPIIFKESTEHFSMTYLVMPVSPSGGNS